MMQTAEMSQGSMSYHAGLSAEHQIADDYAKRGYPTACQRWRGTSGEVDLIAEDGDGLIFIEVKKSKSFDRAASRVTPRQMERVYNTAAEYLGTMPRGQLTDVRFDVAMVNAHGQIKIIENAFGHE
jgi:putative endonuclease